MIWNRYEWRINYSNNRSEIIVNNHWFYTNYTYTYHSKYTKKKEQNPKCFIMKSYDVAKIQTLILKCDSYIVILFLYLAISITNIYFSIIVKRWSHCIKGHFEVDDFSDSGAKLYESSSIVKGRDRCNCYYTHDLLRAQKSASLLVIVDGSVQVSRKETLWIFLEMILWSTILTMHKIFPYFLRAKRCRLSWSSWARMRIDFFSICFNI